MVASQNAMVSPSGVGRSKRTVVTAPSSLGQAPRGRAVGDRTRCALAGIDPRRTHRPCCNEPDTGVNFLRTDTSPGGIRTTC